LYSSESSSNSNYSTNNGDSLLLRDDFDIFSEDDVKTTGNVSQESSELSYGSSVSDMPSEFSKLTINDYLKEGTPFYTINMMIKMDFCNASTL
jgi:hypothetical protein